MLHESHGAPYGIVEYFSNSESGTRLTAVLATSDAMDTEDLGARFVDCLRIKRSMVPFCFYRALVAIDRLIFQQHVEVAGLGYYAA